MENGGQLQHEEQLVEKHPVFWESADGLNRTLPADIPITAKNLPVFTGLQEVQLNTSDGRLHEREVFYRECLPSAAPILTVLFLHGQSFTSQNWDEIGTLQTVAAMGYRAVAIDLPGYGKTNGPGFDGPDAGTFLEAFCRTSTSIKPLNLVVVSPSMSGRYALPYIMSHEARSTGLVAVAPVETSSYSQKTYTNLNVPILHIRGSRDLTLGAEAEQNFAFAPQAITVVLEDAGHAAYMNKPDEWHCLLCNFLSQMKSWFDKHDTFKNFPKDENEDAGVSDPRAESEMKSPKQSCGSGPSGTI